MTRLSLDDFYRDRSHLSEMRRKTINFDHPRAIDWIEVERVLSRLAKGKTVRIPKYNFASHTRKTGQKLVKPKNYVVMDGLWLLQRRSLRGLFSCGIFVDCPQDVCLRRRITRDQKERGRIPSEVRRQFLKDVVPMHQKFVIGQTRWADIVLKQLGAEDFSSLGKRLVKILEQDL